MYTIADFLKNSKLSAILLWLAASFSFQSSAQHSPAHYEWPEDSLVRNQLEKWRDLKFGMIIHWGLYAVPGIVESWSICNEEWISRDSTISYDDYKKWYWGLNKDFNPVRFNPGQWSLAAKNAGMKYLIFTTKHHDGYCMFDTKETDFKITNGPFKNHPKANVTKHVFSEFRKEGLMVGAYFSKPDWHSENYWWPTYATPDRNNNYDIRKFPWRWEKFRQFVYNQIAEITSDYGKLDILWLDGGWVRPIETVNEEVRNWGHLVPWSQDIDLPRISAMARKAQPGLLIVDRTVHGKYENYQTPEQQIPERQLDYPWESCITLANNWGYVPDDVYKPSPVIIHKLVEIVAKGGSLLLGVGPKADGMLPEQAVTKLAEIGEWTKKNGDAIYNTRTLTHYKEGNIYFTKSNLTRTCYAIVLLKENEPLPGKIEWSVNLPDKNSRMICLETGETVKWNSERNKVAVVLPESIRNRLGQIPALAFSFKLEK